MNWLLSLQLLACGLDIIAIVGLYRLLRTEPLPTIRMIGWAWIIACSLSFACILVDLA